MIKQCSLLFACLLLHVLVFAQRGGPVEMADGMRQSGKIYVVVAVVLTILAGIFIYLLRLDRKITRLEKGD